MENQNWMDQAVAGFVKQSFYSGKLLRRFCQAIWM